MLKRQMYGRVGVELLQLIDSAPQRADHLATGFLGPPQERAQNPRSQEDQVARFPANKNLELAIEDMLFRSPGRPSRKPLVRYKSFHYQADSWTTARRVVAKVEHHVGELFPRVGFIVTNLPLPNRAVVRFYNKRGTAEQWIKEGKQAAHWTRLSCHRFRANEVRLQLSVLAYNLGNLWRRLVLPGAIDTWSLTSLQQRLVKTGGRLVKHCPVLLAPAGGEPSDPAPVRVDAPADLGAARADRLTGERCRRPWAKRGRKAGEVSVRMSEASCRASQFGPPGGFFDARSIRGGILTGARSGWCRMRPIKGRQIGNVRNSLQSGCSLAVLALLSSPLHLSPALPLSGRNAFSRLSRHGAPGCGCRRLCLLGCFSRAVVNRLASSGGPIGAHPLTDSLFLCRRHGLALTDPTLAGACGLRLSLRSRWGAGVVCVEVRKGAAEIFHLLP